MKLFLFGVVLSAFLNRVYSGSADSVPQKYLSWKYSYFNPNCSSAGGFNPCQDVRTCNWAFASVAMGGWPTLCGWVGKGVPRVCCGLPLVLGERLMKQVDAEKARKRECGRTSMSLGLSETENTFYQIAKEMPEPDISDPYKYDPPLDLYVPGHVLPVGGIPSRQGDFPWMVVIFRGSSQWCGGTLIDRIHVLSAAHCFVFNRHQSVPNPREYMIRVGNINVDEGHPYNISKIVVHEDYDPEMHYNDIAIMTLSEEILSPVIPNICLPSPELAAKDFTGLNTTLLGWGDLDYREESTPILHVVDDIPVVSNQECKEAYREIEKKALPRGVTDDFICAGVAAGGKDACQKDSGGPLMYKYNPQNLPSYSSDISWVQVGIVSFGYKCGVAGYPGVYTRVSSYMDWIIKNTQYVPKGDQ